LDIRYASGNDNGGGPFHFEIDGMSVSPNIVLASTGGWGVWNTKSSTIELTAGTHVLRFVADQGEFNLGRMTFTFNPDGCAPVGNVGLPFDFESSPLTADFTNFNGGTANVEAVPGNLSDDNCSLNIAKIVRDGGDVWAGAFLDLQGGLDFSNDGFMSLRVWTEAPVGTRVKLKLEQQSNAGNSTELDVFTQTSGEWETLTWNFSSWGPTVFDRVVFMFDFGITGNGSAASTFYFDDVQQVSTVGEPSPSENCFVRLNLKSMFEGPYDEVSGLMNDDLRTLGLISLDEPYAALGYNVPANSTNIVLLSATGETAIVDWILVELRRADDPTVVLTSVSALIQRNGDVVGADGSPLLMDAKGETMVYVALRHRNHFGVRTGQVYSTDAPVNIDFTDTLLDTYGSNPMNPVSGIQVQISGDANGDGQVNSLDKNLFWRIQNALPFDYLFSTADFNLDGIVNAIDKNSYWRTNNSKAEELD